MTSTEQEKNWYTINELATLIERSRKTVWLWVKTKQLRSERVGVQHRILKSDWLETLAVFNQRQ